MHKMIRKLNSGELQSKCKINYKSFANSESLNLDRFNILSEQSYKILVYIK